MATQIQHHGMTLEDWLDDLCVRFIINVPNEDLEEVPRICFQIEEAQWYYEDFIRPLDPTLPNLGLREFCLCIFRHCPLLSSFSEAHSMRAFNEFLTYKKRVPVRGAILLNEAMDSVVLVKGWRKSANWGFPRGKVNKDEDAMECAIREAFEETGFDARKAGVVPAPEDVKYIEQTMRDQEIRLYVFRNVAEDFNFEPQTRKEISQIKWWKISELPGFKRRGQKADSDAAAKANKFYMVASFLGELKSWVMKQKRKDAANAARVSQTVQEEPCATEGESHVTEPPAQEPAPTPSIETIEGANAELRRLLKIQGPTEGVQKHTAVAAPSNDKGSAILALLQGGPARGSADENQQNALPHTPMDHTYTDAPQPQSPHHQHMQPPPSSFETYPPPPAFPYDPSHDPSFAPAYYKQGYEPQNPNQAPLAAHQLAGPQSYLDRHIRNDSIPLVHPQPKPPQVQTGLLRHGMASTPTVTESQGAPGPPQAPLAQNSASYMQQPQLRQQQQQQQQNEQPRLQPQSQQQSHEQAQANPQAHHQPHTQQGPWQTQPGPANVNAHASAARQPPSQLSSHSLSLLNVFKGDAKPPIPSPLHSQGFPHENQPHSQGVSVSQAQQHLQAQPAHSQQQIKAQPVPSQQHHMRPPPGLTRQGHHQELHPQQASSRQAQYAQDPQQGYGTFMASHHPPSSGHGGGFPTSSQQQVAHPAHYHTQQLYPSKAQKLQPQERQQPQAVEAPAPDKQKSALLELFKSSDADTPSRSSAGVIGSPSSIGSQHGAPRPPEQRQIVNHGGYGMSAPEGQGNGVSLGGPITQRGRDSSQNRSTTEAHCVSAQRNGGPVQMQPEVSLPYRAVGILSRPKQSTISPASATSFPAPQSARIRQTMSPFSGQFPAHMRTPSMVSPQQATGDHKRPEPLSKQSTGQGRQIQQQVASSYSPYGGSRMEGDYMSPRGSAGLPEGSVAGQSRRTEGNVEQKQKLLSLFGPSSDEKGKGREVIPGDNGSICGTPRSHVMSVTSGVAGGVGSVGSMSRQGSRRGSQTPISPADRSFLLNYLNDKIDKAGP